jgi:tetratricopeptide (TPR) repeat protein
LDALRRGETDTARQHIEAISSGAHKDLQLAIMGEVDAADNKIDAAIADWREGLKVTGGTSEALTWQLAYVLLRLGRTSDAQPLIDQYHRLTDRRSGGPTPKGVFLDALIALKQNRPKDAIDKLEEIRLKSAANTPGTSKTGLGSDQSLEAQVLFTLAQSYEAFGREVQALEAYRQAAKIVRSTRGLKWPDPWIGAAHVLSRRSSYDEAAGELEDGLVAIPGDSNLLINLTKIRMVQVTQLPKDQQSWSDVEKVLARAQQAAPTSVDLVKLQVAYLMTVNRLNDAANLLATATDPKYHPHNPELWALQAEVLRRLNLPEQALQAVDRGTAAVGEQAILRIARAQVLLRQGLEKAAYETLTEGMGRVPPEQRPLLLQAQAELHRRQDDPASTRKAYAEWAKLEPENPRPQLAILELALARDDVPGAKATITALQKIGGLSAELADAMVLLSGRLNQAQDEKARVAQLNQADRVIKDILTQYPGNAIGYMLQGQLFELRGRVDDAVQAYREARNHSGGPEALRRLFSLLARNRRFDDLKRLKSELHTGELTFDLEQTEANIALLLGDKEQALELARQIVRDNQGIDVRIWQSQFFNKLGKPKEAEAILQSLIQQKPDALEPRLMLMVFQLGQQQFQKAAETVEQIRAQVKTERPEFVWAGCYATIGNTAKATEYYKASLQNWPNDQDVRQRAVAFFRTSGHPEEGEAALREILKQEPKHAWATRELAQLLSAHINTSTGLADQNAWNEALKLIGEKPSETDTADDRLVRATVLARAPDSARRPEAIPILEGLISDSPGAIATMAHDLLARIYADASQPAKALEHAEAATVRNNDPSTITFYIELLLRDKKLDEATKQVDRLAKVESESLRVLGLRALIFQAQGKGQEAASLLEDRFAALEKDNAPDEEAQGRKILEMLVALKQLDAAERVGVRLAERRPRSAWTVAPILAKRGKLGDALKYCKIAADNGSAYEAASTAALLVTTQSLGADAAARLKEADAILDKALKQQPTHFGLLFSRASIKRLMGRYDEAAQLYGDMLTRNPDNPVLLNNMAWTLSEDLNKPADGLEKINTALKQKGSASSRFDPSWLDTRGVILTRLGKFNEAIEDLEASAKASPSPNVYYHLARAYKMAGRTTEFQKYRDLAQQAGLTPSQLQPNERPDMQQVMGK